MNEKPKVYTVEENNNLVVDRSSISYSLAILQPPKTKSNGHTFVTWEGAPHTTKTVVFATIGTVEVVVRPVLPLGYYMEWHPTWELLVNQIYDKNRDATASFEQLDLIVKDCQIFKDDVCGIYYDIPIYYDRDDYGEHSDKVYSSNQNLMNLMVLSIESTFRNTVDEQSEQISSIEEALTLMFPNVSKTSIKSIEDTLAKHNKIAASKRFAWLNEYINDK